MAQRTEIHYIDDISGEPADETVRFGLDKATYEIDLSEKNAQQLHDALEPFIAAGRRVPTTKTAARSVERPTRTDPARIRAIREWARANGHRVSDRGRIPEDIRIRFNNAHQTT